MADAAPQKFEHYDAQLAEKLIAANAAATGLPKYLGIELVEYGPGRLVAEMAVRDELKNPFGMIHGGVVAGLVDHVLGMVAYPLMRRGQWAATTEFKLNYLSAVSGGTLRADTQVVSMTRTTMIVRIDVTNEGRLACIAQGTVLIRDPKPA
ncbi:MAG TPA: PaaI family thioesterase [Myxococcota bacterium]|nr:PaaI family thioesterase [Myxococcota bacterium]